MDTVWVWSKQCNGNLRLGVSVLLDRKVLYRGAIPICRLDRGAENGRLAFRFSGGHVFQNQFRTLPSSLIEGDLWEAGGESDSLVLGISFATPEQILLNTIHIARPASRTTSELDAGLVITTYPLVERNAETK